jgi:hypothetical protein
MEAFKISEERRNNLIQEKEKINQKNIDYDLKLKELKEYKIENSFITEQNELKFK